MMLSSRAERDPKTTEYTPEASKLLDDVAGYIRLYNVVVWASLTNRFSILLTRKGLSRMLSRGVMTKKQYKLLTGLPDPAGRHDASLQWIYTRIMEGVKEGNLPQTNAFDGTITNRILGLRQNMAIIKTTLAGRIPLAYAHFVQFLVDFLLLFAPFGLYPKMGFWSIPAVGILNLFYGGLLDLSKILIFPLENNDDPFYQDNSVNMDLGVLIRESNIASNRWKNVLQTLPF